MEFKLTTNRVVIRELEEQDAYPIYMYRKLDEVKKYQSWDYYTLQKAQALIQKVKRQKFNMNYGSINYAVDYKNTLIGDIYLMIDYVNSSRVILGYTFSPKYWHQGFAYESVSAMIECLFNQYHKKEIYAYVKEGNIASMRLLIKLNFRLESYDENYGDYLFILKR